MSRLKSVLLVDFDNVYGATSEELVTGLSRWLLWLEDGAFSVKNRRRRFIDKRVYWNLPFDIHRSEFERHGFAVFNCRALSKRKTSSGKSSADIVMTMDAIEIALTNPDVQELILLTTDPEFVPVVNRIQDDRLRVVSCGKETDPSYEIFSNYADAVIHIAALKEGFEYQRAKRKWYRFRSPPPEIAPLTLLRERRSALLGRVRLAMAANEAPKDGPPPELMRAAKLIRELGERIPDQLITRARIVKTLSVIPEFSTSSKGERKAWFGHKNYTAMMRRLAQMQQGIDLIPVTKNKVEMVWRETVEAAPVRGDRNEDARSDPRLVPEGETPFSLTEGMEEDTVPEPQARPPLALLTGPPLGLLTSATHDFADDPDPSEEDTIEAEFIEAPGDGEEEETETIGRA